MARTPTGVHERIVGGLLSSDLLLCNVGKALGRYECLVPEASRSEILGAVVDAFEIALSHARLATEHSGRYPRGVTQYKLEDLESRCLEYAAIHIAATDGAIPPNLGSRFSIDDDQVARAAAIAAVYMDVFS